jgi:TonB-linked SusC/RagA family outer membrane protein
MNKLLIVKKIPIAMRITCLLLCLIVFQLQAEDVYSQKTKISLDMKNTTIEKVLQTIEEKSDYHFLYNNKLVNVDRKVSVRVKNAAIADVLNKLFASEDVEYQVEGNQIILSPKEKVMEIVSGVEFAQQQQKTITGKVTDTSGQPLPGATVVVKGTTIGTVSDADGNYSLSNVPPDATLVFSFVGMETQEINVGSRTRIDVTLQEEAIALQEVVAVGYGTMRKSDLTGAVSSVKSDEISATPITSIDQGLGGKAAGVLVTQTSGMPGAVASIRVRGSSSLQGGNEPLYVIDGFPVYGGSGFGNTGGNTRYSALSTINPRDIESIEVLKDASATSIYGSRAANGVVLITTKKGKQGTDRITFGASYGIQNVVKKIDVMNALQYAELVNEAYTNDGLSPYYDEEEMKKIRLNPKGTDWQNEIFRTAPTQNYELTFSGGDQKTTYAVSLNYAAQEGVIINSNFKRYGGRINLERKILSNLNVGTHLNMNKTIANAVRTDVGGQEGVVTAAMKFNPILPVYENKELNKYTLVNLPGILLGNPVASANETVRKNQANRVIGDIFAEWEIIPDLKAKVSFGTDFFDSKFDTFIPDNILESNGTSSATINSGFSTSWLNENTLSWNKKINEMHNISILGGITFQRNNDEGVRASSQNFVNNTLKQNALQTGAVYNQPSSSNTQWSLISYLGRVNYNLKDRYLFTISGRADGSSRFGKNNKYAFFPAGAFAWRVSEENFMKKQDAFSNLKLRLSYGITGNQEIGLYNSLPTLSNTNYTFGRSVVTGFFPNKIPNPDLKWEKTAQFDIGLDMGFFNNRLNITTDYYSKKTTDLIYDVSIPFVSGFSTSLLNSGSIKNQGIELAIQSDNLRGEFEWTTNFNISFNKNKIIELGGEKYKDVGSSDGHLKTGQVHRLIVGKPVGLFYGYVFDGIFQNEAELAAGPKSPTNWIGGRRYKDISGPDGKPDGIVDATYDRTVIGDPNPDFFGGLTNTFYYKGFEVNLFMQYSYGNDLFNYNAMELTLPSGGQNVYADLVNRWTPANPSNKYPKATTNRSAVFSSAYIEDASYLKIKTITLAYMFPNLSSKHVSDLKLYISGNNLFTFTKYRGYDPEVSYRGVTNLEMGEDFGGYPQVKSVLLGISFNIK